MTGIHLEQIKVYKVYVRAKPLQFHSTVGGLSSRQVGRRQRQTLKARDKPAFLTQADSLHRWHQRSQCQGLQLHGPGSCRRRVDGKVWSQICLKSFQLGTIGIALPPLDFGSAHKPGKNESISKLRTESKKDAARAQWKYSYGVSKSKTCNNF